MSENSSQQKKITAVLETIRETVLQSKIHGLSNLVRVSSRIMKTIWFFCFFTSMAYCTYQIILAFIVYFKFEVVTIKRVYYEAPTDFPAVDICNLDAYDGNTARQIIASILDSKNLKPNNFTDAKDYVDKAIEILQSNLEDMAENNTFDTFYNGFYLSQMNITCTYDNKPCDSTDFFWYHDYNYGSCYSFNNKFSNNASNNASQTNYNIKRATKAGWRNGLQLELYVGDTKEQQQFNYKGGVRVLVRNQSDSPFPIDFGMDVATGIQTNIGVTKNFIKHLASPYTKCLSDDKIDWKQNDVLDFMNSSFKFMLYNQKVCLKVCLQKIIIEQCGCFDFKLKPAKRTTSGCTNSSQLECIRQIENNNKNGEECYKKCPIECESQIFRSKTTYAKYPTKWASDLMLNNSIFVKNVIQNSPTRNMSAPTVETLKHTVLMVNVFYEQMFYYETFEEPKNKFETLVATIGGHFGFFLGITILCFGELVEIIFNILYLIVEKKWKKD